MKQYTRKVEFAKHEIKRIKEILNIPEPTNTKPIELLEYRENRQRNENLLVILEDYVNINS